MLVKLTLALTTAEECITCQYGLWINWARAFFLLNLISMETLSSVIFNTFSVKLTYSALHILRKFFHQ